MKCGECPVATTNPKDKTDCYFCPFDKVDAFHSLHDCSHLSELVEKMAELLKEQEHKDKMFHALEDDWKRLNELLKEQQPKTGHWKRTGRKNVYDQKANGTEVMKCTTIKGK